MSLDIKIEKFASHCKISLIGKCNIYTVAKLKQSFLENMQANENILVDLARVTDFDTAGLQLFVSAKNTVKIDKKRIKLISHPECVIALFDLYGLVSFFGDKVVLSPAQKKHFGFSYGVKKLPSFMY